MHIEKKNNITNRDLFPVYLSFCWFNLEALNTEPSTTAEGAEEIRQIKIPATVMICNKTGGN